MGLRNPFRFAVDRDNGEVYLATTRRTPPRRTRRAARPATAAGWSSTSRRNYGWPYCVTPTLPYLDYDFATGASGAPFDCADPVNDSPHNTGRRVLPPVEQPEVCYSLRRRAEFPELGTGGIGPMGGPAYDFDRQQPVADQVAGVLRRHAAVLRVDPRLRQGVPARPAGNQVARSSPVLPSIVFDNPMDHGVRPGRRALRAGVRRRLLRREPGGAAGPDRLRARQPHADPEGHGHADQRRGAADGQLLQRRHDRPRRRRAAYAWDFDADGTVDSTRSRTRPTRSPENGVVSTRR